MTLILLKEEIGRGDSALAHLGWASARLQQLESQGHDFPLIRLEIGGILLVIEENANGSVGYVTEISLCSAIGGKPDVAVEMLPLLGTQSDRPWQFG